MCFRTTLLISNLIRRSLQATNMETTAPTNGFSPKMDTNISAKAGIIDHH